MFKEKGRVGQELGNTYKAFSHSELLCSIKGPFADYKSPKLSPNNYIYYIFLLVNEICNNNQKSWLLSINTSSFCIFKKVVLYLFMSKSIHPKDTR